MLRATTVALALTALCLPAPAAAAFGPGDDGDEAQSERAMTLDEGGAEAVVRVHGFQPIVQSVEYRNGRLQVPLTQGPAHVTAFSLRDPLVKRLALVNGKHPRLFVFLRTPKRMTAELSTQARVELTDDGFRLVIPRQLPPAQTPAVTLDEAPAPPQVLVPPAEASAAASGPAESTPPELTGEPLELAGPVPVLNMGPTETAENPDSGADLGVGDAGPRGTFSPAWFGLMGLLACGALVVVGRRRRKPLKVPDLQVVSSQSLGGRTRVMVIDAAGRRFLVAAGDKGVTLLDRWQADETDELVEAWEGPTLDLSRREEPRNEALADTVPPFASEPALSGVLRLRKALDEQRREEEDPNVVALDRRVS